MYFYPSTFLSGLLSCSLLFHETLAIGAGQLGIRVNDQLLRSPARKLVIGSVAEIAGLSGWTDQQIADMAFVAHGDVERAYRDYFQHNSNANDPGLPGATVVLVVDDTAYISSSLKGGAYVYVQGSRGGPQNAAFDPAHPCTVVTRALTECQSKEGNRGIHRTGAACGEVMCVFAFCSTQREQSLTGAKVVAIHGEEDDAKIIPPCGDPSGRLKYPGQWGCHDFIMASGLGFDAIPMGTARTPTDVSANDITITYAAYP